MTVNRKKVLIFLLAILMAFPICSCGKKEETKYQYQIYYVNKAGTKVLSTEYGTDTEKEDVQNLLPELIQQLKAITGKPECIPPLAGNYSVVKYELMGEQLNVDFDEKYLGQETVTEVLNRAAIVRTLTQIEGVNTVTFSVLGAPLTDAQGMPIGIMMAESFIDNTDREFSTYEKATLRLYFANEAGDKLKEVTRNVILNNNVSMEKTVMDELIKGPDIEAADMLWPTINSQTQIQTVMVKDGVCYVDLDKAFLVQTGNVTGEVAIYSIVNSMAELNNVNKVQISVDGETDVKFRENLNLSTVFERNLDIVQKEK
ncbi:MAG: hypothetical protein E7299_09545 [Lachnospiraceae bacterium]|nr:hypothetical protein [Lachnospiraceae bacterium]